MKKTVVLILLISFGIALIAYILLPQNIPIQLTSEGLRYTDKIIVFAFALVPILIYYSIVRNRNKKK